MRHASGTGMLNCLAKSKATITERLSLRTWPSTTSCWNSVRLLLPIIPVKTHVARTELDVLTHSLREKLIFGVLHDKSGFEPYLAYLLRLRPDVHAVQNDFAFIGSEKTVQHLHER